MTENLNIFKSVTLILQWPVSLQIVLTAHGQEGIHDMTGLCELLRYISAYHGLNNNIIKSMAPSQGCPTLAASREPVLLRNMSVTGVSSAPGLLLVNHTNVKLFC